jgi:hypothetical protein
MSFEYFRDIMNDALARRCAFGQLRPQAIAGRKSIQSRHKMVKSSQKHLIFPVDCS